MWYSSGAFSIYRLRGSLKAIGPHNPTGSDMIKRRSFVGVGLALLEEVCHCGGELRGFPCSGYCTVSQLIPCRLQDVELSATSSVPRLHVHCHAPRRDDNGPNL